MIGGFLFLVAITDLFLRKVVGWASGDHLDAELSCEALCRALARRNPSRGLIFHSDRGSEFAAGAFRQPPFQKLLRPKLFHLLRRPSKKLRRRALPGRRRPSKHRQPHLPIRTGIPLDRRCKEWRSFRSVIDLLATFAATSLCLYTLSQIRATKKTLAYLASRSDPPPVVHENRKIHIIIPVYHEATILPETVGYFASFAASSIDVTFVTTQKEGNSLTNKSLAFLATYEPKYYRIVHYPHTKGAKAEQVNFAIISLATGNLESSSSASYYAVFDADSRPDPRGLLYVQNDRDNPPLYQMFPLYTTNLRSLPILAQANAIYQSRKSLSLELPHTLSNYLASRILRLTYLVGHGLFIREDVWKHRPIPHYSIAEDIAYGYELSFAGFLTKPVPYFDFCSVPDTLLASTWQTSRWFAGEISLFREYARALASGRFLHKTALLFRRLFHIGAWLLGPPMVLVGLSSPARTVSSSVCYWESDCTCILCTCSQRMRFPPATSASASECTSSSLSRCSRHFSVPP